MMTVMQMGTSRVRVVAAAGLVLAWATATAAAPPGLTQAISAREAVAQAVAVRLGPGAKSVEVVEIATAVAAEPGLEAVPDPAGRVGEATRFALTVDGRRRGTAVATVRVTALVARAERTIDRQEVIEPGSVEVVERDITGLPIRRLPDGAGVIGARARREIPTGATVTGGMVIVPPDVRSGDTVTVHVTVGRAHVSAEGTASGSGHIGDLVHVARPGRRGLLKARVTGRGVVEIVP